MDLEEFDMLPFHENHGKLIFSHFLLGMLHSRPGKKKKYQWYGEGLV